MLLLQDELCPQAGLDWIDSVKIQPVHFFLLGVSQCQSLWLTRVYYAVCYRNSFGHQGKLSHMGLQFPPLLEASGVLPLDPPARTELDMAAGSPEMQTREQKVERGRLWPEFTEMAGHSAWRFVFISIRYV